MVTLYDRRGNVLWVDNHFVPEAIRPQRAGDFRLPLTPYEQITALPLTRENASGDPRITGFDQLPADVIPLPPGYGYDYLRVSVNTFTAKDN